MNSLATNMKVDGQKSASSFYKAAEIVYTSTSASDRTIRDLVRDLTIYHMKALKEEIVLDDTKDVKKEYTLSNLLVDLPDLALDVVDGLANLTASHGAVVAFCGGPKGCLRAYMGTASNGATSQQKCPKCSA